jgi:hypothetical protein
VPKSEVEGMEAPKAAPGHPNFIDVALLLERGHKFLTEETVVAVMVLDPLGRVQVLGVPAIMVAAIEAKQLYFSRLNKPTGRFNQEKVFGLMVASARSRKNDDWVALRTKNQHLNGVPEMMGMKGAVFFVQNSKNLEGERRVGEK